ncbi:MAG: extracellular solute-binding protein, partial [Candidatus Eremiobacteraeota bacterium]|nr:extracellular solute-binding protein [Candidatus Eremiobacteraeota bacterium]
PAKLAGRPVPTSLFELSDPAWKGETAFSMPLFGTSLTHCAALRQQLGPDQMKQWLDGSLANGMQVVDGNAVVKDRVVAGLYTWGFTDTDDANSAIEDGAPVKMVIPDQDGIGTLVIPNTVSILKNCPHPEQARRLVDYLLSAEVEQRLAAGRSLQIPLHQGVELPAGVPDISQLKVMQVDYETMAAEFTDTLNWLRQAVDR